MTTSRFFTQNGTIALTGPTGTYGFGFADSTPGGEFESHHWVIEGNFLGAPGSTDQFVEPADVSRRYTTIDEWRNALFSTGPNPLWPGPSATYLKANCKLFDSISSTDASCYDLPYPDPVPSPSNRPLANPLPKEIDPGQVFMYDPTSGTQTGAAVRELGAMTTSDELWILTDSYAAPGPGQTQSIGPYPAGAEKPPLDTRESFLEFYQPLWEPGFKLVSLAICRYVGYFPAP